MVEPEEGFRAPELEILSDISDDDGHEELENVGSAEHAGANEIAETPPPTLTIGAVLDKLPKIKSGMAKFEISYSRNWIIN